MDKLKYDVNSRIDYRIDFQCNRCKRIMCNVPCYFDTQFNKNTVPDLACECGWNHFTPYSLPIYYDRRVNKERYQEVIKEMTMLLHEMLWNSSTHPISHYSKEINSLIKKGAGLLYKV